MATKEPGTFLENLGVMAMMNTLTTLTMTFHQFYRIEVMEVKNPFSDKIARYFFTFKIKSENIGNLGSKDCNGNTAVKTNNNRIRNKLDNGS